MRLVGGGIGCDSFMTKIALLLIILMRLEQKQDEMMGRLLLKAIVSWFFSPFPYEIRRAKLRMIMIALPFPNKEECSEESSAENDSSESADDAQSARTHSLWINWING